MAAGGGVGVVFGGPSPEHDISILTGLQAARSLHDGGADVRCLYWAKSGAWFTVPATAEAADFLEPEVKGSAPVSLGVPEGFVERRRRRASPLNLRSVLNCCHGGPGEDGSLAALLMMAGIRVSGPRPGPAALAMDKLATSAVAESIGVPSIETVLWPLPSNPTATAPLAATAPSTTTSNPHPTATAPSAATATAPSTTTSAPHPPANPTTPSNQPPNPAAPSTTTAPAPLPANPNSPANPNPTAAATAPDLGGPRRLPEPPWVVKPRWGGSSIDVEAGVEDAATVEALASRGVGRAGVLVQPYLRGWIDLNVAVRTWPGPQCSAVERPLLGDAAILGYDEKYLAGAAGMESAARELPARIPPVIRDRVTAQALALAEAMDLTGAPRFDFLWDGGETVLMCEVNPIPGAWGNYLWRESGVDRAALYNDLLSEAEAGPSRPHQWMPSSDGRALRVSNSIAAKLL